MDRQMALKQWYRQTWTAMLEEIARLLSSPAKYLDSRLTEEPTSGKDLYERFGEVCGYVSADFPEWVPYIPIRRYEADEVGSLRRQDLVSLEQDIQAFLRIPGVTA